MMSIYTSSLLGRNGCDVFLHDIEREVESTYANKYLKQRIQIVKRMGHYQLLDS